MLLAPAPASRAQDSGSKQALGAHHVQNENLGPFFPVEDPARRFNNLPVPPALQLWRLGAAFRMISQLCDMVKLFSSLRGDGRWSAITRPFGSWPRFLDQRRIDHATEKHFSDVAFAVLIVCAIDDRK